MAAATARREAVAARAGVLADLADRIPERAEARPAADSPPAAAFTRQAVLVDLAAMVAELEAPATAAERAVVTALAVSGKERGRSVSLEATARPCLAMRLWPPMAPPAVATSDRAMAARAETAQAAAAKATAMDLAATGQATDTGAAQVERATARAATGKRMARGMLPA